MDDTTAPQPVAIEASEPITPAATPSAAATTSQKPSKAKGVALLVGAGVVGGLLVLGAGAAGYAIGHADNGGRHEIAFAGDRVQGDAQGNSQNGTQRGPGMMGGQNGQSQQGQQGQGQGGPGMMGGQGFGQGVDPDGDNWTGGGQQGQGQGGPGMMGGQGFGQQGQSQRGQGSDQLRSDIQQFMQQFMNRGNA